MFGNSHPIKKPTRTPNFLKFSEVRIVCATAFMSSLPWINIHRVSRMAHVGNRVQARLTAFLESGDSRFPFVRIFFKPSCIQRRLHSNVLAVKPSRHSSTVANAISKERSLAFRILSGYLIPASGTRNTVHIEAPTIRSMATMALHVSQQIRSQTQA